jgi:hypothetical protein
MAHSISKEELKAALLDLVRSDRTFASSLLGELLLQLPVQATAAQTDKKQPQPRTKKTSRKIIPAYRQDIKEVYPEAGLSKPTIIELRELFSDAPPAEDIVRMLQK